MFYGNLWMNDGNQVMVCFLGNRQNWDIWLEHLDPRMSPVVLMLVFFPPRFYKLHERKCEPVVMTVPRKVSPVLHFYENISNMQLFFFIFFCKRIVAANCSVLPLSRTCIRTTCTQTRLDPTPPWRPRNGLMARTESPSTSPSRTAMYRARTVN